MGQLCVSFDKAANIVEKCNLCVTVKHIWKPSLWRRDIQLNDTQPNNTLHKPITKTFSIMTLSIMVLSMTPVSKMTIILLTISIETLCIMILSIVTLFITTLSITTLSLLAQLRLSIEFMVLRVTHFILSLCWMSLRSVVMLNVVAPSLYYKLQFCTSGPLGANITKLLRS
jgi:hypothetical protein